MKKQRKHYTPEEKVAILRRHLVEGCRSRIWPFAARRLELRLSEMPCLRQLAGKALGPNFHPQRKMDLSDSDPQENSSSFVFRVPGYSS
jgi:hypothetical protein